MKMRLIHIQQPDFPSASPFKKRLKLMDEVGSFFRISLGQQLLAFFPTQAGRLEHRSQRAAAGTMAQFGFDPLPQFLHRPALADQPHLNRRFGFDRVDHFGLRRWTKRGDRLYGSATLALKLIVVIVSLLMSCEIHPVT